MRIWLLLQLMLLPVYGRAQPVLHGQVFARRTSDQLLDSVRIEDLYTHQQTFSDSCGDFTIPSVAGHLVAFSRKGYQTAHLRVQANAGAALYRIILLPRGVQPPPRSGPGPSNCTFPPKPHSRRIIY